MPGSREVLRTVILDQAETLETTRATLCELPEFPVAFGPANDRDEASP